MLQKMITLHRMKLASNNRIPELDLLKCLFITLMVMFHLAYFSQLHPYAHEIVYSFHMPGFLLISGYLMNLRKEPAKFLRYILFLLIPYLIMESGYIIMASILPINEHIDGLTPSLFLNKLLLNPTGPYWYLQTIIICELIAYGTTKTTQSNSLDCMLICAILFYLISLALSKFSFVYSLYFLAGFIIRQSGRGFMEVIRPWALSIIPFAALCLSPETINPKWMLPAYFAISTALWLCRFIKGRLSAFLQFIGRNSLVIYIFSPIFTILCKQLIPLFKADATGLLFAFISTPLCIAGSLGIGKLLDIMKISPLMFGKEKSVA